MAAHDLDILVLGRQANVRYVTGAPQLWVAGTRPFGPGCVLVRATGAIHLLSTWDEGVPEDIPHENLYGISWNPMNTIAALQRIDGAATARRVGTDALSPGFAQLLPTAFPNAELVDGELAMRAARRIKTDEEVAALREAIAVAESSLAVAVAELAPGVREQTLAGVLVEAAAAGGVSTPLNQDVAWVTSARASVAPGQRRPAALKMVTWWHFPPGCWPVVTRVRSGEPGQWATDGMRRQCLSSVPALGRFVVPADSRLPAGCLRRRIARRLPIRGRTGAPDAGGPGTGHGL